jgi:hypothetical protein
MMHYDNIFAEAPSSGQNEELNVGNKWERNVNCGPLEIDVKFSVTDVR